jgi:hypothetical protein
MIKQGDFVHSIYHYMYRVFDDVQVEKNNQSMKYDTVSKIYAHRMLACKLEFILSNLVFPNSGMTTSLTLCA